MIQVEKYPTGIGGLALGILGLGASWGLIFKGAYLGATLISLAVGLLFLAPLLYKFIKHPHLLISDLKHPVAGSTVPASSMALMIIGSILSHWWFVLGISLWSFAIAAHLVFFLTFIFHRIKKPVVNDIIPSWFVPPVGIVTACVTVPSLAYTHFASYIFAFGICAYFIMLPIVLIKLFTTEKLDHVRAPTLAILAAPASLCLAGYLTIAAHPNLLLTLLLFSISCLMLLSIYLLLIYLLRLPFSPAFSCLTFPLAISTTAMYKISNFAATIPELSKHAAVLHGFAIGELIIATLVITYVAGLFIKFLVENKIYHSPSAKQNQVENSIRC